MGEDKKTQTHHNMNKSGRHDIRDDKQRQILSDSIYKTSLRQANPYRESRMKVAQSGGTDRCCPKEQSWVVVVMAA